MRCFVSGCLSLLALVGSCAAPPTPQPAWTPTPISTVTPSPRDAEAARRASEAATRASRCSGNRIQAALTVQQALARLRPVPPKNEFETTEAFRAHAAAANPNFPVDDAAIVLPIHPAQTRYDADARVLHLAETGHLFFTSSAWQGQTGYTSLAYLSVDRNLRDTGSYTAANAFGARTEVVRRRGTDIGFSTPDMTGRNFWPRGHFGGGLSFRIPMPLDEARAAQGNLAVMVVGPLEPPFVLQGRDQGSPTWRIPVERNVSVRALSMRPDCLVLVNRAAGRVLSSVPP
jgi:hypothetical protein